MKVANLEKLNLLKLRKLASKKRFKSWSRKKLLSFLKSKMVLIQSDGQSFWIFKK